MQNKHSHQTIFEDFPSGAVLRGPQDSFQNSRGFNLIELALVITIILITLTMTLPSLQGFLRSYRAEGDAKHISSQLALARMRSAANFTQSRLFFDLASNSFQLETYNKTSAKFEPEGGAQNLRHRRVWIRKSDHTGRHADFHRPTGSLPRFLRQIHREHRMHFV